VITFTIEMTEGQATVLIDALVVAGEAAQSLGRMLRSERGLIAVEAVSALAVRFRAQLDAQTLGVVAR
jgi:hypothetical protein